MFLKMNIKKILFLLPLIIIVFSFSNTYAESFTSGDANTSVYVETNTSGGKSETHISIETNGEKNVVNSNNDGTVEIKTNSSSTSSQIKNTIALPSIIKNHTIKKPAPTYKIKKIKSEKKTSLEYILSNIENMLSSFFK